MASHNIDSRYDVTDTRGPEPHARLINPYIRGAAEAVRIKQWIEIKQQPSSLNAATGKHSEGLLMASLDCLKLKTEKQSMTACQTAPQSTYRGLCTHYRDI